MVSIHALLAECDINQNRKTIDYESFNPRTPCGVRLIMWGKGKNIWKFQSTHSLRSATGVRVRPVVGDEVSIHALLAECDNSPGALIPGTSSFNPRTPCGVRPLRTSLTNTMISFNPRTPCGVRLRDPIRNQLCPSFNPRTPCGVRRLVLTPGSIIVLFQSTHSLRSATPPATMIIEYDNVSIHALLAECDRLSSRNT